MTMKPTKLSTPLRYQHEITLTGQGAFAVDMLRYDRCSPKTEQDSRKITSYNGFRAITVIRNTDTKIPRWTLDRWASYGWYPVDEAGA